MELNKKAAYLQGLVDGLGIDDTTKEGKIIKACLLYTSMALLPPMVRPQAPQTETDRKEKHMENLNDCLSYTSRCV